MSDVSQGPGWWIAGDDKWYPPEDHPDIVHRAIWSTDEPERVGPPDALADLRGGTSTHGTSNQSPGSAASSLTADILDSLPADYSVTHGLRVAGTEARIDHVVVGPTGVWVIETKAYEGAVTAHGGTLWLDDFPMEAEHDVVAQHARLVSAATGMSAVPILCFTAATVPKRMAPVGGVRCLEASALRSHITKGKSSLDAGLVQQIPDLLPAVSSGAVSLSGFRDDTHPPGRDLPQRTADVVIKARRRGVRLSLKVGLLAMIVLATIVMFGQLVNDSSKTPVLSTPTTDGARALGSAEVGITLECDATAGWSATLGWPVGSRDYAAHHVVVTENDVELAVLDWMVVGDVGAPVTGLTPGSTIVVTNEASAKRSDDIVVATTSADVPPEQC